MPYLCDTNKIFGCGFEAQVRMVRANVANPCMYVCMYVCIISVREPDKNIFNCHRHQSTIIIIESRTQTQTLLRNVGSGYETLSMPLSIVV